MAGYVDGSDFAGDPDFDWTGGAPAAQTGGSSGTTTGFVIDDYDSGVDVDAIEREQEERRFQTAPIGNHLFEIVGFHKAPALKTKEGFVNGQPATYEAYATTVKFAIVGKPNQTILHYMELPPGGKAKRDIYKAFKKNANGTVPGWYSRLFEQFLKSLGYAVVEGQPYPKEALAIDNWIGKQVHAEVIKGDGEAKMNPGTGEMWPINNQFKNFSFRIAESTAAQQAAGGSAAAAQRPAGAGVAPAPAGNGQQAGAPVGAGQRAPAGTDAASFVSAGRVNI